MITGTEGTTSATPKFVREREAWFKAGASAMGSLVFLGTLLVGVLVSVAALIIGLEPYVAVSATVIGTWLSVAIAHFYIEVTAHRTASNGGVQVDRF